MNDTIIAQGAEINQIRDALEKHKKEFESLRNAFDQAEARKLNRMFTTAGNINNMADQNRKTPIATQSTQRNMVVEGLKGDSELEMVTNLLHITSQLGVIVYKLDIDEILRMKRRDLTNKAPGPVLVRFNRISVRDNVLKRKIDLHDMEDMKSVYINADEPVEVRRKKAIYRRVAYKAKNAGEMVELRHDHINISGVSYTLDEITKIPAKYLPEKDEGLKQDQAASAPLATEAQEIPTNEAERSQKQRCKPGLIRRGKKMRLVEAGLCFSGPTAYPSNMYPAEITYDNKNYKSNEQTYQCQKATLHNEPDLAAALKEMSNAYKIKIDTSEIATTEEWNLSAPAFLWELFDKKMKAHPELLERLIETAPLLLIEASTSFRWGGGAPFESDLYDTGKYPGKNEFGELATRNRDLEIQRRENDSMT